MKIWRLRRVFRLTATRLTLWLALAVTTLVVIGCGETATRRSDATSEPSHLDATSDKALDDRPSIDAEDVSEADSVSDVSDVSDGSVDRAFDAASDLPELDVDAAVDLGSGPPDADDGSTDISSDVRVYVVEAGPDPFGDCTVPRVDVPDAAPACVPERTSTCACVSGAVGSRTCLEDQTWSACQCPPSDAGPGPIVPAVPPGTFTPVPTIPGPRLLAPQSGSRVTTQRPTFRWRMPDGTTRARVELCADRPCARMFAQQEVSGASWRPTELLSAGVVFWRVRGLDAAGGVNWTSATWEFGVPHRDTPVDTSYGVLKDFNGDTYDDVVVKADGYFGVGMLHVYPGGPRGLEGGQVRFIDLPRPQSIGSSAFGECFSAGDLNGDGLSDLVVGDPLYDEPAHPEIVWPSDGRAYVFFGSRTCVLVQSEISYRPTERGKPFEFGSDVSAGDFNGDGYSDILVATDLGYGSGNGEELKLYIGGPFGPMQIPVSIASVGARTAQYVGDVNGDGYSDVIARARNYREPGLNDFALVVLYGNPDGRLDYHVQYIELPFRSAIYEWIIRWGDVNEDTFADAIVSFNGYVYVFYGSMDGIRRFRRLDTPPDTAGGAGASSFGIGLSFPADVDGDGHAELLAGAAVARGGDGQVYVFTSRTGDLGASWSDEIPGPISRHQNFSAAAIMGDVNGDGFNDVAVGAPSSFSGATPGLYVYSGGRERWWETPYLVIENLRSRIVQ